MKLAFKMTLAVAAAIVVVMGIHDYLLVREEVRLFDSDLQRGIQLKRAVLAGVEALWRAHGELEARHLVEQTIGGSMEGVDIRWLWRDAPAGDPRHVDLDRAQLEQLDKGNRVVFFRRDEGSDPHRFTYLPLGIEGSRLAVLEISESIAGEHSFIRTSRLQILLMTFVILVLCTAAVYAAGVWFVGRPLQRLRDKARALGAGEFGPPLAFGQRDEIGDLAGEIDDMCDRLADAHRRLGEETEARVAAMEQMRHTDRLTTVGQLASGVAHELGTPLAVVAGRAEMIVSGEAQGDGAKASARVISGQVSLMTALIRRLLDFSRRRGPRLGAVDIAAVVARTTQILAPFARKRGVTLELSVSSEPTVVSADENQIQQALTNIIMNAVQSIRKRGSVKIDLGTPLAHRPGDDNAPERRWACVTVADEGGGIEPEDLPRIFESFFTTKDVGEGTGLGLWVARGIVQEHGGWIGVESEVGRGSRFAIFLPSSADAPRQMEVA